VFYSKVNFKGTYFRGHEHSTPSVDSTIRQEIWEASYREVLNYVREAGNSSNVFAVFMMKDEEIVLSIEPSSRSML